jgi:hypothetical protein
MQVKAAKQDKIPWWVWAGLGLLFLVGSCLPGGGDRCPRCGEWMK